MKEEQGRYIESENRIVNLLDTIENQRFEHKFLKQEALTEWETTN